MGTQPQLTDPNPKVRMSQWSKLPVDLLTLIDEYTSGYVDKILLRCVCEHWQSIPPKLPDLRRPQPPWLLMPYTSGSLCGLYHPLEKKVYEIDLPEAGDRVFKGSGHGWVVTVQQNGSISVVNPLSRLRFPLPPRYTFPDVLKYRPDKLGDEYLFRPDRYIVRGILHHPYTLDSIHVRNHKIVKIALSSAPTSDDFRAVAIYGGISRLAYCMLGDKKWCDLVEIDTGRFTYIDITFYHGKLYATSCQGELMTCDDIVPCPKLRKYVRLTENLGFPRYVHLINSSNGLMAVQRGAHCREVQVSDINGGLKPSFIFKTTYFNIFKLDMSFLSWIRLESLDYEILFMGLGTQWCILSQNLSTDVRNQIYFSTGVENLHFDCQDMKDCFDNGIFHIRDGQFEPLGCECNPQIVWPSPVWVIPNPY